jgi:hypothetical protein
MNTEATEDIKKAASDIAEDFKKDVENDAR